MRVRFILDDLVDLFFYLGGKVDIQPSGKVNNYNVIDPFNSDS